MIFVYTRIIDYLTCNLLQLFKENITIFTLTLIYTCKHLSVVIKGSQKLRGVDA